jgi:hypothetical protein
MTAIGVMTFLCKGNDGSRKRIAATWRTEALRGKASIFTPNAVGRTIRACCTLSSWRPDSDRERDGSREQEDLDPASYAYWAASGYRGRPPWRRGYRWGYFALSLAAAACLFALFWLAGSGRL